MSAILKCLTRVPKGGSRHVHIVFNPRASEPRKRRTLNNRNPRSEQAVSGLQSANPIPPVTEFGGAGPISHISRLTRYSFCSPPATYGLLTLSPSQNNFLKMFLGREPYGGIGALTEGTPFRGEGNNETILFHLSD